MTLRKYACALSLLATMASTPVVIAPNNSGAKQDMSAGQDTKDAAKDTGNATKKTAKKTGHAMKKGTNKAANKTEQGAQKVQNKTQDNPPPQ